MFGFLGKLLDSNEKEITRLRQTVSRINSFAEAIKKIKSNDVAKKTAEFKGGFQVRRRG